MNEKNINRKKLWVFGWFARFVCAYFLHFSWMQWAASVRLLGSQFDPHHFVGGFFCSYGNISKLKHSKKKSVIVICTSQYQNVFIIILLHIRQKALYCTNECAQQLWLTWERNVFFYVKILRWMQQLIPKKKNDYNVDFFYINERNYSIKMSIIKCKVKKKL